MKARNNILFGCTLRYSSVQVIFCIVLLLFPGFSSFAYEGSDNNFLDEYYGHGHKFSNFKLVDNFEQRNRAVMERNFKSGSFSHVAQNYSSMPEFLRLRIHNFFSNIGDISCTVHAILQWDFSAFSDNFWRLFLNTTVGLGGLFDIATSFNIQGEYRNLTQTLYYYGVVSDAYFVLPVLGSMSASVMLGTIIDFIFLNPIVWWLDKSAILFLASLQVLDNYSELNMLLESEMFDRALDRYITMRSIFKQRILSSPRKKKKEVVYYFGSYRINSIRAFYKDDAEYI